MSLKKIAQVFLMTVCAVSISSTAYAKKNDLPEVQTAWVVGQEAFPAWFAKKQGWDKEAGFNLTMHTYASGVEALQGFDTTTWVFGGLGAIPTLLGAAKGNMSVLAIANNEANANAVMVRPDSPILSVKGADPKYPEIYGDPKTVRGKTFWCTNASSAQYTLQAWLQSIGLTEKDVVVKNLEQALSLVSFSHGLGDGLVLWAPYTFMGDQNGWVTAATAKDAGVALPIFLVANTAYSKQYEKVTGNFVRIYMRGLHWLLNAPRDKAILAMQEYYKDLFNQDYSVNMVGLHFKAFQLFTLAEQKTLLNATAGASEAEKWQTGITEFFAKEGLITKAEMKKIIANKYITSKYIDMLTEKDVQ